MNAVIIVPSIGIDPLLERCVRECRRAYADVRIIVLVDDGAGAERLEGACDLVVTGPVTIARKRNIGAGMTTADYLAFIDSDAYPADGWLPNAVRLLEGDPGLGAIGGPNVSPPVESRSERFVGNAHNSFLVAGWWKYRRDATAHARDVNALPSCNLIVRRRDYEAVGGMNEALFTAEDTDFCRRFTDAGARIGFSPDVLVFHKNRDLRSFAVQRFTFGVAMVPLLQKGRAPDVGYTAASGVLAAFVLFVAAGPLAVLSPRWRRTWVGVMAAYAALLGVEAARQSGSRRDVAGTYAALAIGNLAPGVGAVLKLADLVPDLQGIYRNDRNAAQHIAEGSSSATSSAATAAPMSS